MSAYPIYTIESAPEKSKPVLRQLQQAFGLIPNIAGAMAGSPVLISGFVGVFQQVHSGSFTEAEIQTLLLTNAVTNASTWAVAFHTALALKEGLDPSDVQAIRERRAPSDIKHAALSNMARTLIEKRGRVDDQDIAMFTQAGFTRNTVLDVILVVAASTITNYTGSVTQPRLEAMFQEHAWKA
ncbi:carboxymuconolactone decarboxylase family protein [Burkholderia sp. L27(2015)]|jgi:alkylhydroperoxidase family enzyme|uniref:carboxymuconolactone decarboxylase family protein n=1 Tax=Burkholderia sp. L27(2015) TaxID=1641858 RepID=UPI00131AB735|nr:carboxymuconolactone decarboxylase family protein [Burkholderia sp. L27(2015)]